jgi:alpha-L-arabinofuranosidase
VPWTDSSFREIEGWISGHPRPGQDPVRIAVTEWNVTAGGWGRERATMLTLSNALIVSRYHHVMHRHADSVEISNRSNLSDSFCSGILQPGPGWMVLTPAYHAQRLYSRGSDSYPIECERQGRLPWSIEDPDLSALLSADGTMLRLYAVHSTAESSEVRIRLDGFGRAPRSATAWVLADGESPPSVEATNSRDEPRRVDVSRRPVALGESPIRLRLEPYSLTLLECEFPQAGS